jgi:hypothetical protein
VELQKSFQERLQPVEVEGVRSVGFCLGGVVVDFEEDAIDPGGDRGACQNGNELRLSAGDSVAGRGGLDGVGAVEDDGGHLAHDGQGADVDDEVVVAEGGAALSEADAGVSGVRDFLDGVLHVEGGDELALLDVDGAAGFCGGDEQVGLTAEEGGNLQDGFDVAERFGGLFALLGGVDVGEDGEAVRLGDGAQDAAAFFEARASKAGDRGSIGLVVAGFEDVGHAEVRGDALNGVGHFARVRFGLDDAGTGDEEELGAADGDGAGLELVGVAHVVKDKCEGLEGVGFGPA